MGGGRGAHPRRVQLTLTLTLTLTSTLTLTLALSPNLSLSPTLSLTLTLTLTLNLGEFSSVLGAAECYARHLSLRACEAQAAANISRRSPVDLP